MDVDSFIAKHRPEWRQLEQATARGSRGLTKLSGEQLSEVVTLYLRTSAHLAEVQTLYRDMRLESYLTTVVARAHAVVYGTRPRTLRGFLRVLGPRYREAAGRTAPFILVAAVILAAVSVATLLWVTGSAQARAGVVPPIARDAIRKVGGSRPDLGLAPAAVSALIFFNNARVAAMGFAFGVGLGIGTIYLLVQNGVILGAIAGGFHAAGKAGPFWSLVLPHGLLELTAICIATGAGLRMGWSIIDPKDRFRTKALAEESRDAIMVAVGVVPAFLAAALIEGFVTPSGLPAPLTIGLGAVVAIGYVLLLLGPSRKTAKVRGGRRL